MKKLMFVLLLLVSFAMLLAVESDPSAVVGYVKYDCVTGLNFVAMPMVDGLTLTSEVGAVYNTSAENIDTINLWDSATQSWVPSTNYGGGFWDPDLPVEPGSVLYFNTIAPLSFYSLGSLPATNATYNIVTGLNTIMIPLNMSVLTLTSEVGANIGGDTYLDTINLWDSATQSWVPATNYGGGFWDPDLAVTIGAPLFVNSLGDVTWPTRGGSAARISTSRN